MRSDTMSSPSIMWHTPSKRSQNLWRAMDTRPHTAIATQPVSIEPGTRDFEVIHNYPETVALFREFSFSMIDNPVAQRLFARSISMEQACRFKNVDFAAFQNALTGAIRKNCSGPDLIQIAPNRA